MQKGSLLFLFICKKPLAAFNTKQTAMYHFTKKIASAVLRIAAFTIQYVEYAQTCVQPDEVG